MISSTKNEEISSEVDEKEAVGGKLDFRYALRKFR